MCQACEVMGVWVMRVCVGHSCVWVMRVWVMRVCVCVGHPCV